MAQHCDSSQCKNFELASRKEWLLANGIGGYAMGTVSGANTRRYHGHLVAATKPPSVRTILLANMEAFVQAEGIPIGLSCNQYQGALHPEGFQYLESFDVGRTADWRFKVGGMELRKQLAIHPGNNASTLVYTNAGNRALALILRPLVAHKFYHDNFRVRDGYPERLDFPKNQTIVGHRGVTLFISHEGAQRVPAQGWYYRFEYQREMERGLDPRDDLYCPCELKYELLPGEQATVVASTENGHKPYMPEEPPAEKGVAGALREAAGKYFVKTDNRTSIMAGFPWFTDWGRDTMISIPGLCLHTGRLEEAKQIVRDYASQMRQGLIPNRFIDSGEESEYNTADATLWFVHAIYRILESAWDEEFARACSKPLEEVLFWHQHGTFFGIRVDPVDGLLSQGEPGVQLTWMDAKVGDWVVTPRHGKPVEVNGLWINALRAMEWIGSRLSADFETPCRVAAELAESHFEKKFWRDQVGHYLDTADPDDASLRPNQLIAMSLPFGPAKGEQANQAFAKISRELLTENGLRTLAPDEPAYRGRFHGPLPELDSAYHQGTVWPWLLGPYVSALVKLTGDRAEARRILKPCREWLVDYGLGGIAEVYDGDKPRYPGGCPWQAWNIAEILRAWVEDANGK